MKTVIVTAGGTREDIDEVRFLTNVSTGKLGALIADFLQLSGFDVRFIGTETSAQPTFVPQGQRLTVRSTQDTFDALEGTLGFAVKDADAIVHAMACGDFGFKPTKEKLKSDSPEAFIDSLRDRIVVNPKILKYFREWNRTIYIVSFKFETGKTIEELCQIAQTSMAGAGGDMVVANDKAEMTARNAHVAHIMKKGIPGQAEAVGKEAIARYIVHTLMNRFNQGPIQVVV